jgi:lactate permease
MAAVIAGMIIQSTPVSFGAAGTPILVGVSTGLSNDLAVRELITTIDVMTFEALLDSIAVKVAFLHALAGTFVPLIVVSMMTGLFGAKRSFAEGLRAWKFALFAAFAMTVPYFLSAVFLGPEFPSLLGGLAGLAIVITAARKKGNSEPECEYVLRLVALFYCCRTAGNYATRCVAIQVNHAKCSDTRP